MEIDGEDTNESKVPIAESIPSTSSSARNGEYQQPQPPQPVVNGLELHGLNHQIQEAQITVAPIPTPTLINGISVGIQSDKVIELSPFTRLISTSSVKQSALNHAAWNGSDAYISTFETALLAIGGKELGQIWEINKMEIRGGELGTLNNPSPDHHYSRKVIHPQSIIDLDVGPTKTLVSLAWSPDAGKLAYSTFSDDVEGPRRSVIRTRMRLPDTDGDTYTTVPEAVTNLVWNKTGRYIAGLSSMSVIILDTRTGTQFKPLNIEHTLFDAAWLDSETLVICGDSTITIATLSGGSISMSHTFRELAGSTEWTKLRYNNTLNSFAIVSETSGDLAVVQARGKTYKEVCAHSPGIIDLAYEGYPNEDQGSLLVTSAADGSVKVWNLGSGISLVQTLAMGGVSQALSLSFSPDHKLLAVADWDKVLFWDIRQATQPKYKWELRRMDWQSLQNGHKPNGVHHDHDMNMTETDDGAPILLWDGLGSMLTFVHKDKVVFNFIRNKYIF